MINNTTAKASISDYKTHTDNNRDIVTEHLAWASRQAHPFCKRSFRLCDNMEVQFLYPFLLLSFPSGAIPLMSTRSMTDALQRFFHQAILLYFRFRLFFGSWLFLQSSPRAIQFFSTSIIWRRISLNNKITIEKQAFHTKYVFLLSLFLWSYDFGVWGKRQTIRTCE